MCKHYQKLIDVFDNMGIDFPKEIRTPRGTTVVLEPYIKNVGIHKDFDEFESHILKKTLLYGISVNNKKFDEITKDMVEIDSNERKLFIVFGAAYVDYQQFSGKFSFNTGHTGNMIEIIKKKIREGSNIFNTVVSEKEIKEIRLKMMFNENVQLEHIKNTVAKKMFKMEKKINDTEKMKKFRKDVRDVLKEIYYEERKNNL